VNVNGTLVEAKMRTFTLESTHFIFNKCPINTHDGASFKFSTKSQETDYSAVKIVRERVRGRGWRLLSLCPRRTSGRVVDFLWNH
jgi:hypothetical protein